MDDRIWANHAHVFPAGAKPGGEIDKLKALMDAHQVTKDKAREIMLKTDKRRSSYYNYYSNKRWGDSRSYDFCINSSAVGIEGAVDLILTFARAEKAYREKKAD